MGSKKAILVYPGLEIRVSSVQQRVHQLEPRAQGSLKFSCCSLKFLQGAQSCTVLHTTPLIALEDAIGLPGRQS